MSEHEDLPPKPPITEPMPSDEEIENSESPGDEDVDDDRFMSADDASADETVDDGEDDTRWD